MNTSFSCDRCTGVCCTTPPVLTVEEAKNMGKEKVIGLNVNGLYYLMLKPIEKVCPFLVDAQCSIYESRFDFCKNYHCTALDTPLKVLANVGDSNKYNKLLGSKKAIISASNVDITLAQMQKIATIITVDEWIVMTNTSTGEMQKYINGCDFEESYITDVLPIETVKAEFEVNPKTWATHFADIMTWGGFKVMADKAGVLYKSKPRKLGTFNMWRNYTLDDVKEVIRRRHQTLQGSPNHVRHIPQKIKMLERIKEIESEISTLSNINC